MLWPTLQWSISTPSDSLFEVSVVLPTRGRATQMMLPTGHVHLFHRACFRSKPLFFYESLPSYVDGGSPRVFAWQTTQEQRSRKWTVLAKVSNSLEPIIKRT